MGHIETSEIVKEKKLILDAEFFNFNRDFYYNMPLLTATLDKSLEIKDEFKKFKSNSVDVDIFYNKDFFKDKSPYVVCKNTLISVVEGMYYKQIPSIKKVRISPSDYKEQLRLFVEFYKEGR